MKILVAEDDDNIRAGLVHILEREGYRCLQAAGGKQALAVYAKDHPDFICLDIMMPELNGYEVCKEIRRGDQHTPILFISAKSEEVDRVLGLELGGDDFIMKPFGVREVLARIRAIARRLLAQQANHARHAPFTLDDLEVFPAELRARRGGEVIDLGPRDVKILQLLHDNRGRALDRNEIFDTCWGVDYFANSRALDQHISQLRKRIERDPKQPRIIRTVHGVGYRYEGEAVDRRL
ncbi:MAG: response regulator transcription factor [Candidatus Hydrogenedentes bacterium]|nr:response regulator transcription factor [Candidatus Hydrogenedentota bacterium]